MHTILPLFLNLREKHMPIKFKELPSQEYLNECFDYDPETGELFHKKERPLSHFASPRYSRMWHTRCSGKLAGTLNKYSGYHIVDIGGVKHKQHRIIWKMVYGSAPEMELDHKDRNRANNRLGNLREADASGNGCNVTTQSRSPTGHKNVRRSRQGDYWEVKIMGTDKRPHLFGCFKTMEEAVVAAEEIRLAVHGEYAQDAHILCPDKGNLPDFNELLRKYRSRPFGGNTSGVRGIQRHKKTGKWQIITTHKGKRAYLGVFSSLEDAIHVLEAYKQSLQTP